MSDRRTCRSTRHARRTDVEPTRLVTEYTSEPTPPSPATRRPSVPAPRRRVPPPAAARRPSSACASCPAPAQFTINGRTLEDYFPNKVHQQLVNEPLTAARARRRLRRPRAPPRRRPLRPGRRAAPRRRPRAERHRRGAQPPGPEEGRLPHPRRARHGAQEVRSQEGPQGAAVLQALIRRHGATQTWLPCSHRRRHPLPGAAFGAFRSRFDSHRRERHPMGRLFGTDGVRGLANAVSPPSWPSRSRSPRPRARPGRCRPGSPRPGGRRSRPAGLRRDPQAAVDRRARGGGRRRLRRRRAADPGRGLPDVRRGRRLRRHDLRLAQPDARQRHQVLRPGRPQAARRGRGPHRGGHRRGVAAAHRRRRRPGRHACQDGHDRYLSHLLRVLPNRLDGLKVVVDCAHGAAAASRPRCSGRGRRGRSRSTPSPTGSTSTTAAARPTSTRCRPPSWRTAPTSASRTTATPTAASRSTPPARRSTATRSWPSSPWPSRSAGRSPTTPSSPP